ncbi:MAG: hypothetical protein K2J71_00455 [Oscillospiraceae bacterium]|nr:hypothetical protein [Oscillospiraceae bacterium]
MTFQDELEILKAEYYRKIALFEKDKVKDSVCRDANGNAEHKIDLWYLHAIQELKKKYDK